MPDEIADLFAADAPSALALVEISPADEASDVAVVSNIVLTFNNKISRESIIVTEDDGTLVEGTKTWDTAGKVLTFEPTENLSASTVYLVTVGGVVDIYGQALSAVVNNFMTVN